MVLLSPILSQNSWAEAEVDEAVMVVAIKKYTIYWDK